MAELVDFNEKGDDNISSPMEIMSPNTSQSPTPISSPTTPYSSSPDLPSSQDGAPLDSEINAKPNAEVDDGTSSKTRSEIWVHYTKKKINGQQKARCKYCNNLLLGDPSQGTSHLRKHYGRCKKRTIKDIRQQVLQANFNKDKQLDLSSNNFDQESSRKELARMIIMHEYPMKMVEHVGFKIFLSSVNPCFKLVSRNTIKNDCVKVYEAMKVDVMRIFEKCESRVAITTDMWTSSYQKKGFMVVTAHFIDTNWKLQSRIIRFVYVPSPHSSEVLCEALIECFLDWNLERKLSTITVDNCTTNDSMINMLLEKLSTDSLLVGGKLLHMRCCAHILNLIVKVGLDIIGDTIENVRDSVSYWSGTPKRWEKFEETARHLGVQIGKKLLLDCKTRWNSTYLMLQTALEYKNVFFRLKHRDAKYKCVPTEAEWNLTNQICGKLKLFYNVTELFSGTKYPTANLYFPKICEIKLALGQWLICGVEVVQKMAFNMMDKFDKYWSDVHGIMGVATLLDPRYKTVLLEFYFRKIYVAESEKEVEKILDLCRELLTQYELKEKDCDASCSTENHNVVDPSLCEYDLYASTRKRKSVRSELDQYLEEDVLPRTPDFDVLVWWKFNKGKYPILHRIAKDVLAIPVSTVASESAFSTSGRLISPHRSRLHHKTVEALMCAQNWILSERENSTSGEHETMLYDSDDEKIEILDV